MQKTNYLGYTYNTAVLTANNAYDSVIVTDHKGVSTEYFEDMFIKAYLSDEPCFENWSGGIECAYRAYQYGDVLSTKPY